MGGSQPETVPFRVLIVEDDPDMGAITTLLLQLAGFEVRLVCNGHEALEALNAWRFHVILLDLMMPCMNGLDFLAERHCRQLAEATPVLCVSAASADMLDHARRLGATECLEKPPDFDQLVELVAHHCPAE